MPGRMPAHDTESGRPASCNSAAKALSGADILNENDKSASGSPERVPFTVDRARGPQHLKPCNEEQIFQVALQSTGNGSDLRVTRLRALSWPQAAALQVSKPCKDPSSQVAPRASTTGADGPLSKRQSRDPQTKLHGSAAADGADADSYVAATTS